MEQNEDINKTDKKEQKAKRELTPQYPFQKQN